VRAAAVLFYIEKASEGVALDSEFNLMPSVEKALEM
jgi:hypothetical protein